jgi:hypothetical protein
MRVLLPTNATSLVCVSRGCLRRAPSTGGESAGETPGRAAPTDDQFRGSDVPPAAPPSAPPRPPWPLGPAPSASPVPTAWERGAGDLISSSYEAAASGRVAGAPAAPPTPAATPRGRPKGLKRLLREALANGTPVPAAALQAAIDRREAAPPDLLAAVAARGGLVHAHLLPQLLRLPAPEAAPVPDAALQRPTAGSATDGAVGRSAPGVQPAAEVPWSGVTIAPSAEVEVAFMAGKLKKKGMAVRGVDIKALNYRRRLFACYRVAWSCPVFVASPLGVPSPPRSPRQEGAPGLLRCSRWNTWGDAECDVRRGQGMVHH